MRPSKLVLLLLGLIALLPLVLHGEQPAAVPAAPASTVDRRADEVLRKMGAMLQAAQRISFASHAIVDQAQDDGQRVQYAKTRRYGYAAPTSSRAM